MVLSVVMLLHGAGSDGNVSSCKPYISAIAGESADSRPSFEDLSLMKEYSLSPKEVASFAGGAGVAGCPYSALKSRPCARSSAMVSPCVVLGAEDSV